MRIIEGLSFFVSGECFAVDVTLVQKVSRGLEITPVPSAPYEVIGIANIKGKVVTILNLAALLKRKQDTELKGGPLTVNAVVFKPFEGDSDQMGLVIDKPGDLVEMDGNPSQTEPPPLTESGEGDLHISGLFESGGVLCRIVNVKSIISRFSDGGDRRAVSGQQGGTVSGKNV